MPRLMAFLLLAIVLAALTAGRAGAQETLTFDIRAQSLSGALVEFSRRSGVVVVAPATLLAGKRAPAVRGALSADAALAQLLARSGLEPRRRGGGGLTLVAAPPAAARAGPVEPSGAVESAIVVTGQPLTAMTQAYANALAGAPPPTEQIPRWNSGLCASVAGIAPAEAQALIDHIAERAHEVGLEVEGAGCARNVVVVFAPDSDAVAQRVVETRRDLMGYFDSEGTATAGRQALRDFAAVPRAVRWWHVSTLMGDGRPVGAIRPPRRTTGSPLMGDMSGNEGASGFDGVDGVRAQGTRVRRETSYDLSFVLIIVDTRRVAESSPGALADYLAMAALTQVNPRADMTGFNSILNLFAAQSDDPPATAMTAWDLAYLHSLYASDRNAATTRLHAADIARRMAARMRDD